MAQGRASSSCQRRLAKAGHLLAQRSVQKDSNATANKSPKFKQSPRARTGTTRYGEHSACMGACTGKGALVLATETALLLLCHIKPCSVPSQRLSAGMGACTGKCALVLATEAALLLVCHIKPCNVPSQCPSSKSP